MTRRVLVQAVAGVVIVVFATGIWLTGGTPQLGWLRFFSAAVVAALAALWLWDHWLWSRPLLQRLKATPIDLRGTWKGTLESFWRDPQTGQPVPAKSTYLVIRQSAVSISVALLTDESRSRSSLATITDSGVALSLDYMYLNRPDSRFEAKSRIHHGAASLDVIGRPCVRLRGRYWTSRDSRGELDFTERVSGVAADDFDEAERLFMKAVAGSATPASTRERSNG